MPPSAVSHTSLSLVAGTVENVGAGSWLSPTARRVHSAANLTADSGGASVRPAYSSVELRSSSESKRTGGTSDPSVPAWKKRTRKASGGRADSVREDEFNFSAGLAPRTRARNRATLLPSAAAAAASPAAAAQISLPPVPRHDAQ